MLITTLTCKLRKVTGMNQYAEETLGPVTTERCAPVRLRHSQAHSSVRADSTASRGAADEDQADSIVLLTPTTKAELGDQLEVADLKLRIVQLHPRFGMAGKLEHWEIRGEFWI
jgi:hypothetical protein